MIPQEISNALARMRHQVETGTMSRADVEAMGKELANLPDVRSLVAKSAIRKKINSAVFACGRLADDLAAANPGHTRDHDPRFLRITRTRLDGSTYVELVEEIRGDEE